MSDARSLPRPGDVLAGGYVVRERIGEGGMGVVFRALQPALARTVAIKVLHPELAGDEMFTRRLYQEARAGSRVQHPGAVAILGLELAGPGAPFLVMRHVEGRSLGHVIAEEELPLPRVLAIAEQILAALGAVHARGVIHADVKSDNFLVDPQPGGDVVTLIDFGLAMVDGVWGDAGFVSGTPGYLAPELVRGGPPTIASDLYGVGIILYEMLTGTVPFSEAASRTIPTHMFEAELGDDVALPPRQRRMRALPPLIAELVMRALDKDPARRFASAAELAAELREVAALAAVFGGAAAPVSADLDAPTVPRFGPRHRTAEGSASGRARAMLRRVISRGISRGDKAAIADGYARLASLLAREQRVGAAIRELEEGVDVLTAGGGPRAADAPAQVHRLVVALTALQRRADGRAR